MAYLAIGFQSREKLLHQAFFMGLERGEFLGLGGDAVIEGSEAVGDFLLFGEARVN
jgi:hypothetical protein